MTELQQTVTAIQVQAHLEQMRQTLVVTSEHLVWLMHLQLVASAVVIVLMFVAMGLHLHTQQLQRKMRAALLALTDNYEKRLQIACSRIDLLEKVVGLRPVGTVEPPPEPPQVLM